MKPTMYFLMGMGAGAALTMLYAPRSGAETRDLLSKKARAGADYAKRSASQSGDYLMRQAEDLKKTAAETVERGKASAMAPIQNFAKVMDAGRQAYDDTLRKASEVGA
jgi:gas vesicle protein